MMRTALALLLVTLPMAAQDFSITVGSWATRFDTSARIDPDTGPGEGTRVRFERDLALDDSKSTPRLGLQWRFARRHELAATWFSASRDGFANIDREISFRDQVYPVQAQVTTALDLDYVSATYTYWARRTERDGFGITLGLARIALDASVTAELPGSSVTVSQQANTDAPIALIGVQGRIAFTPRIVGEASVSTLPRVKISDYTGRALAGSARLEFRPVRWLGVGAAYEHFHLDVDVEQAAGLRGKLDMTIRGPEAYVRVGW